MLGYTPPRPAFWKALLATALPVAVVAWSLQFLRLRIPFAVLATLAAAGWLAISAAIQSIVLKDWRSQYELNRLTFEHDPAAKPEFPVADER